MICGVEIMVKNTLKVTRLYLRHLEGQRNGLKNLLSDIVNKRIKRVFILHKDMLSTIGFDYFKMICDMTHTEIVILEVSDNKCNNRNLIK